MSGLLVEGQNNRISRVLRSLLPAERRPPDCWRKTRIVRVGGPRVGPLLIQMDHGIAVEVRQEARFPIRVIRASGPNRSHALESALTQTGSPNPRNNRICITSSCPRQSLKLLLSMMLAAILAL